LPQSRFFRRRAALRIMAVLDRPKLACSDALSALESEENVLRNSSGSMARS